jgi:aquaporin Z
MESARKPLTEFVGTMLLVVLIALSVQHAGQMAPLAIGLGLTGLIYMGRWLSGAQYNPVVTLAVLIGGKMSVADFLPYLLAQLAGALCGSALGFVMTGKVLAPAPAAGLGAALLAEAVMTFMMVLVILNVATAKRTEGNQFYGAAIGLTVTAAIYAGGNLSGSVMNPAVAIGPIVMDALVGEARSFSTGWLYIVGPVVGALLAAGVFRVQAGGAEGAGGTGR